MQSNIPAISAPTDLANVRLAIVVGGEVRSVPAAGLGNAFGFQPLDSDLTAIAALATTSFGRNLLTLADAAAGRTAFALGTAATQNTGTSGANVPLLNGTNTWSGVQTLSAIPDLTGGGIKFPATQVPSADANTLDDYEEGTFTPSFAATGATFSYSSQLGVYTKIGRAVFFSVDIILNTSGNTLTANNLTVTGLPFTTSGSNGQGVFQVRWTGSTTSYVSLFVRVSGTSLVVEGLTAAATTLSVVVANGALHATNGTTFRVIGSYYV